MEKKSGDRRVRRTQRMLKESLLSLMEERPFCEITVADIAERADVNRATFYLHFASPSRLLEGIGDDLLGEMQTLIEAHREELVGGDSLRPFLEQVLDATISSKELCALLFANGQESRFAEKLLNLVRQQGAEIVRAKSGGCPSQSLPYVIDFISCGLIGMIRSWFHRGMDLPRRELLDAAELLTDSASAWTVCRAPEEV